MPAPEVPEGLVKLLQDFTVAILRAKPESLEKFGAEYFTRIVNSLPPENRPSENRPPENRPPSQPQKSSTTSTFKMDRNSSKSKLTIKPVDDEDSDSEFQKRMESQMKNSRFTNRRASVAAEPYNPEDDENDTSGGVGRKLSFHEKPAETAAHLKEVCKNIVLFNELSDKELDDVVNAMFERMVTAGEDIIQEMDDGDNFYIITSGKYKATIHDESGEEKVVKEYDGVGYFGELALMYNAPRSATVTAVSDGQLWALTRASFRKLVLGHAAKRRRDFVSLLHSVKILTDLTPYQRMSLADSLERRNVPKGECIIKQGDPGVEIFFVMDGTVRVMREENGIEKELSKVTKGGYFGELALLSSKPRAASVYAETDVLLAVLGVESFERLLGPCIDLMRKQADEYKGSTSPEL
ncbi:unnamed protein product [Dibothriocephalus latus]|uniref:Cyclic nucleotide-binding domain-containing protein n=1 Tax=Dibothriocephalus latus TaxID=60516 RepID=A0A3P6SQ34_DIBLA|nr:unnamed protein product [Dibothriocephalus latus]